MVGDAVACPHCEQTTTLVNPLTAAEPVRAAPQFAAGPGASPVAGVADQIMQNVERVVVGKRHQIMVTLVAILSPKYWPSLKYGLPM